MRFRHFLTLAWFVPVALFIACLHEQAWAVAEEDLLAPEVAFKFSARLRDPQAIEVTFKIAPGYYMYRERFRFSTKPAGVGLEPVRLPEGKRKFDQTFQKEVETYRDELRFTVPFQRAGGAPFDLVVTSQGCADVGVCYPPMESVQRIVPLQAVPAATNTPALPPPPDSDVEGALGRGELGSVLVVFWLLGVGLSLTPCVYPMLPILAAMLAGQGSRLSSLRGLALAGAYSLGVALVFTAMGVAAGLLGEGLAASFQHPVVLAVFAGLLLILALGTFGVFQMRLPAAWHQRIHDLTHRVPGGSFAGAWVIGLTSGLLVGPCVTPPLSAALLYIGKTGDAWVGGWALFALALGMCLPLWVLGASAGRWLPKAGAWMQKVQRLFGALLVGTAFWVVAPVLPVWSAMLGWGVLALVAATYLRAFDPVPAGDSGWQYLIKSLGVVLALVGVALIVGMLSGGRDLYQPLKHLVGAAGGAVRSAAGSVHFDRVSSLEALEARLAQASGPVILDFYADWCVTCIEMERFTFAEPRVAKALSTFTRLQVDVTKNTDQDRALLKRFNLFGPPAILFFDASGAELKSLRTLGFEDAAHFLPKLQQAISHPLAPSGS